MIYDLNQITGKALEYVTEEQPRSGIFVHARVISSKIFKEEEKAGTGTDTVTEPYEWIGIGALISSECPCCWVLSYEDYYTAEQYDSRNIECGAEADFQYKKADFSLSYRNETYDECRMLLKIFRPTEEGTRIQVFYRIPAGYDGCILGFHNSAGLTQEQLERGMSNPAASLGRIERTDGDVYIRLK